MRDCEIKENDGKTTPVVKPNKRRRKKKESPKKAGVKKKKVPTRRTRTAKKIAQKKIKEALKCKKSDDGESSGSETLGEEDTDDDDEMLALEEEEASDVDEHGNIVGLIDYDMPDEIIPIRKSTRKKRSRRQFLKNKALSHARKKKRNQNVIQDIEIIEFDGVPHHHHQFMQPMIRQPPQQADDSLTKMLVLSQLCGQIEEMDKRRRVIKRRKRKKKKKKKESESEDEDESSDEEDDSDSSYIDDEEDYDLRDMLTAPEEKYFKKLTKKKRNRCVEEYDMLRMHNIASIPLKFMILQMEHISMQSKAFLMNRLHSFQSMEPTDNEYHKLNSWFTQFQKLPLNNYTKFPMSKTDNSSKEIYKFLADSRATLDGSVYGHDHVKDEIIQLISGWISNEAGTGQVLALQGPPGNGKTTLVKDGLSKVLGRPFALIALGGAKDSAFLQGHDYTFEGSKPGRIIEVIRDAGSMNPVIFFDEVDKLSESPSGKEISNLLCHLLDPVQNSTFQDRYFSGIDIDLSKAVFVMSFNHIEKVDPILLDRMRVIQMKGFKSSDKIKIAQDYLMPSICKEFNFKQKDITMPDDSIKHIIDKYTNEQGVRDLRRKLGTIVAKLNVLKLIGKRSESKLKKIVKFTLPGKTKFPLKVSTEQIDALLRRDGAHGASVPSMYM
jgi:ATP-dependent Lon protease